MTCVVCGSLAADNCLTAMPLSKALTKAASGACAANTRGLPLTLTCEPATAICSIRLMPPTVLRNCDGGLTWNGRTASARLKSRASLPLLRSW